MTPLSRIMYQVAKTILQKNFFYSHIWRVIKTTNNAFLMTLLSRIMHHVAKIIMYWNFFGIQTIILQYQILLHFQWPRCLGSCTRLLKQYSPGTFFYIHILRVIKTTNNTFLMNLLSRIMHQVAKVIIYWNFF